MKKIFGILLIAMTFLFGMTNVSAETHDDYRELISASACSMQSVNVKSLERTLRLNDEQVPEVEEVFGIFKFQTYEASITFDERERKAIFDEAVYINRENMKRILTKKQMREYDKILDATLKDRGIQFVSEKIDK